MTQQDFIESLVLDLRYRGEPFDRHDLETFALDVWPLAEEEPYPGRWVREFLESRPPVPPDPNNLFPDITADGEALHAERLRLLALDLFFPEPCEGANVFLDGAGLGECFTPTKSDGPTGGV